MRAHPGGDDRQIHPYLYRPFELPGPVVAARAYICGVGLYQLELNGQKVGDEELAPFCNAYDQWLQYQTYDVTHSLREGTNLISVLLGNGWYKGRYCGDGGKHAALYGDRFALICELHLTLADGTQRRIVTDSTWGWQPAPVLASDIYDGEHVDGRIAPPAANGPAAKGVVTVDLGVGRLQARRSVPVRIQNELRPQAILQTPAGETVVDMGQNLTGWLRFHTRAPAGTTIRLEHGEVLQSGNFYRDNLRTARAEYVYIANGDDSWVQPRFTFFGFRYVKVTGWVGPLTLDDLVGCVVHSDLEETGQIETSHAKVNQLFRNAFWGQKGNFLDIPTDCPQRDERLGWTGDTMIFSGTACFNMESSAFFSKYAYDLALEQAKRGGMVPLVVPAVDMPGGGSSAWGDVATILPWTVYEFYGDRAIIEQQYASMRAWVEFIRAADAAAGHRRLWTTGFHFGDWLALDGADPNSPMGGTPEEFVASAYYWHSTRLVARAADLLGRTEEAREYAALAVEIRTAIQQEFLTPAGRLALQTQTGFVLALALELVPPEFQARVVADLVTRLRKDKLHLRTGFLGTPHLCRVLSNGGANDLAYQLLLNEDYPSWLYAVNLGATTIWERWNSLNPDGTVSSSGMNSFNHYAYGSIVEWMYRDMCGLNPAVPGSTVMGFRRAYLAPKPHPSLRWARACYESAAGRYESGWALGAQGTLQFEFLIPFNAEAQVVLPDAPEGAITLNGELGTTGIRQGHALVLNLPAGRYRVEYQPTRPYARTYSTRTPIAQMVQNEQVWAVLTGAIPMLAMIDASMLAAIGEATLREMAATPYLPLTPEQLAALDQALSGITG